MHNSALNPVYVMLRDVSVARSWLSVLALTVVALVVQETLAFRAIYLSDSGREGAVTAVEWAVWVAAPYLVAIVMMIIARRTPGPRRLSMIAALLVIALGGGFAVAALLDGSSDPMVGLLWMLAPLVQLAAGIGIGVGVFADVWSERRTRSPQ